MPRKSEQTAKKYKQKAPSSSEPKSSEEMAQPTAVKRLPQTKRGGAKRRTKVLVDNEQGLTPAAFNKFIYRAGILRKKAEFHNKLREIVYKITDLIVTKSLVFTRYSRKKTLTLQDVFDGIRASGFYSAITVNVNSHTEFLDAAPTKKKQTKEGAKKHRFHPGVKTKQNIRHYQKFTDHLIFPKLSFFKMVKQISQNSAMYPEEKINFAKGVTAVIQANVECILTQILVDAAHLLNKEITLTDDHLDVILRLKYREIQMRLDPIQRRQRLAEKRKN